MQVPQNELWEKLNQQRYEISQRLVIKYEIPQYDRA